MTDLDEFMSRYNPNGTHPVTEVSVDTETARDGSPFIVIRHGNRAVVVNPLAFDDHLCVDVHPFVNGKDATAGAFGMSAGRRVAFPHTGTTSHGWASTNLVAVLVGEQGNESR